MEVSSLQLDLDNSVAVKKDFVRLSQSLQVELEKIRQAETEVRWQHEEDVEECNSCRQQFSVTRRKHHCRHCGRIFCTDCVTKQVKFIFPFISRNIQVVWEYIYNLIIFTEKDVRGL